MPQVSRKVMILDDDIISVMVVEELLTTHGHAVVKLSAAHGSAAKLDYERPEVLLVDPAMPRLAFDELMGHIQKTPDHEDLVVVLYSDQAASQLAETCHDKDLNGYFCKAKAIADLPEFVDQFFV